MERLTSKYWRNLDPWEMCGQDNYCKRGCHDQGGCTKGCIVPRIYARLAVYEDTGLEPYEIKGFAEDVAYQFGYYFPIKDILYISTGGFPHWSGHSGFSDGTTHILFQSVNAKSPVATNTQLAALRQRMTIKEYAESIL